MTAMDVESICTHNEKLKNLKKSLEREEFNLDRFSYEKIFFSVYKDV